MAGIKGKTKKKPPPKSEERKKPVAAAKSRAPVKPAAAPTKASKVSAVPAKPATTKAAPPKPAASPKPAVAATPAPSPQPKPAPAPPAPTFIFQSTPKTHVPPKPLAAGALTLDKLAQVSLTATNLDLAVEFYRDILGLKFIARLDPPGLAFFNLGGGVRLMLSATASQATLYFAVENLETAIRELKARGVSFLHAPMRFQRDDAGQFGKKGAEEWIALFRDPSGNILGLFERRAG
jgi:methylmalonyl-CoA/ethylmalonyl-CoA epimerase